MLSRLCHPRLLQSSKRAIPAAIFRQLVTTAIAQAKSQSRNASTFTEMLAARQTTNMGDATPTLAQKILGRSQPSSRNEAYAIMAGCAVVMGGVCAYGYAQSQEQKMGPNENLLLWPNYVRDRLNLVYVYLAAAVPVTAIPAFLSARSSFLPKMTTPGSIPIWTVAAALIIGSGYWVRSVGYENTMHKLLAWTVHYGGMGVMLAPLCVLGGAPVFRSLCYIAGALTGLATTGMFAPSEKFHNICVPINMALGAAFVANVGKLYFPAQTALTGGTPQAMVAAFVVAFSAYLFYESQRVIKMAQTMPDHGKPTGKINANVREDMHMADRGFDPINAQLSFFMDTINLGRLFNRSHHQ